MKRLPIIVNAKVWMWQGKGAWQFITIEPDAADIVRDQYIWPRKGFGSIPVKVTIGKTEWKTSVFPEKKGTFLLPIKKAVRAAENIGEGDKVKVVIEVIN